MSVHILNQGLTDMVRLSRRDYEALVEDAKAWRDNREDLEALLRQDEERPTLSSDLMTAVISKELHPLAAWRKSLNLTQAALAEKAKVRRATIAEIENGKDARVSTICALAKALDLEAGDLIP